MILIAGDVGGTKSWLTLLERSNNGQRNMIHEGRYRSQDYASLEKLIHKFLVDSEFSINDVGAMVLAIPGPIMDGTARLTNLDWLVHEDELRTQFSLNNLKIINDFQAAALGTLSLRPDDYIVLNHSPRGDNAIRLVMGAGTGLGMAYLYKSDETSHYTPVATEGGHVDFAPTNDREIALFQYFKERYKRVSYERILSGSGLVDLFCFCAGRTPDDFQVSAEWVNREATEEGNPIAQDALRLFATIYGRFAGNMVLAFKPSDGLYLTGGVTAKVGNWLDSKDFKDAYLDKGRMVDVVANTPLYLVTNERVGLEGAISSLDFQTML